MADKKSIIDRVLDEQEKKKQEELQREQNICVVDQKQQVKLHSYINDVLGKLEYNKPEYNPRGMWIGNAKWDIRSNSTSIDAEARIGFSKKSLIMNVSYNDIISLDHANTLLSEYSQKVNIGPNKIYLCICFVTDYLDDEDVKDLFQSYDHFGFSPFIFNLKNNELIYNKNNWKTSFFADWIDPGKKPRDMIDLLRDISDSHSIFTIEKIKKQYLFDDKEAETMLTNLIDQNKIMRLNRGEYGVIE